MSEDINIGAISEALNNKVDLNQMNTNAQGLSYVSGLGMPSNRYIDLTLGASGTSYTAPANGWFVFAKKASANGQYVYFGHSSIPYGLSGGDSKIMLPAIKGQKYTLTYNLAGSTSNFRFIYAEGSQPQD